MWKTLKRQHCVCTRQDIVFNLTTVALLGNTYTKIQTTQLSPTETSVNTWSATKCTHPPVHLRFIHWQYKHFHVYTIHSFLPQNHKYSQSWYHQLQLFFSLVILTQHYRNFHTINRSFKILQFRLQTSLSVPPFYHMTEKLWFPILEFKPFLVLKSKNIPQS